MFDTKIKTLLLHPFCHVRQEKQATSHSSHLFILVAVRKEDVFHSRPTPTLQANNKSVEMPSDATGLDFVQAAQRKQQE